MRLPVTFGLKIVKNAVNKMGLVRLSPKCQVKIKETVFWTEGLFCGVIHFQVCCTQQTFICSESTIEMIEKGVKYVQS